MLITDTERRLAREETILAVNPIADADQIEAVQVGGWTVVTRKGDFNPGDKVIYFEIDTALPLEDARFAFLRPRGCRTVDGADYHVLRTAKLRGTYSQGLVMPLADFPDLESLTFAKWETPPPVIAGQQAGPFPSGVEKTDSERVQNLRDVWDRISAYDWVPTEKVDGTSVTVFRDDTGELRVAGRNWEIARGDEQNVYWRAVLDAFGPDGPPTVHGQVIQGEIVGPNIQSNRLGLPKVRLFAFTFMVDGNHVSRSDWPDWLVPFAVPTVDLPFPATPEDAVTQVDGLKSVVSPGRLAEGVVWHTATGVRVPELGRSTWKAISNRYLLKEK